MKKWKKIALCVTAAVLSIAVFALSICLTIALNPAPGPDFVDIEYPNAVTLKDATGRHEIKLKINGRDQTSKKNDIYMSYRVNGTQDKVYNDIIDSFKDDNTVKCVVENNALFITVNTDEGACYYAVYDRNLLLNFKCNLSLAGVKKPLSIIFPINCLADIDEFMELYQDGYSVGDGRPKAVKDFQSVKDFYSSLNYYEITEGEDSITLTKGKTKFKVNFITPDGVKKIYINRLFE